MPEHAEAGERKGDGLGEEDTADRGGEVGEGVSDAADYEGCEEGCVCVVRRAVSTMGEDVDCQKLVWE